MAYNKADNGYKKEESYFDSGVRAYKAGNMAEAEKWWIKDFEDGDYYRTGYNSAWNMYAINSGKDKAKAAKWLKTNANRGDVKSMYVLATEYKGDKEISNLEKDLRRSVYWLGQIMDLSFSGYEYRESDYKKNLYGRDLHYKKAAKELIKELADEGVAEAQYFWATRNKLSLTKKHDWLKKAADQGHEKAKIALAQVKKDIHEAPQKRANFCADVREKASLISSDAKRLVYLQQTGCR